MKVLLVNNHYRPQPGGAEAVVLMTHRLLEQEGHEVIPFALREPDTLASPYADAFPDAGPDPSLRRAATREAVRSPTVATALRRLVRSTRPDVAHLHNVYEKLTLSVVDVLADEGIPSVMTLHDFRAVCANGYLFADGRPCERCVGRDPFRGALHRCVRGDLRSSLVAAAEASWNRRRRTYRSIAEFIAPSRTMATIVKRGGLPPSSIHVVPNPVDRAQSPRRRPPGRSTFLFAARLVPEKGIDVVLEAAQRGDHTIVVCGSGPEEHRIRACAEIQENLTYVGAVSRDGLRRRIDSALAVLVPSLWYENCPMAVLEAAGRGVPAIGSSHGGVAELIAQGRDGILVPAGDAGALARAMDDLARDPLRSVDLGQAAWERAGERHDPGEYVDAITKLYVGAMRRRRPRASGAPATGAAR